MTTTTDTARRVHHQGAPGWSRNTPALERETGPNLSKEGGEVVPFSCDERAGMAVFADGQEDGGMGTGREHCGPMSHSDDTDEEALQRNLKNGHHHATHSRHGRDRCRAAGVGESTGTATGEDGTSMGSSRRNESGKPALPAGPPPPPTSPPPCLARRASHRETTLSARRSSSTHADSEKGGRPDTAGDTSNRTHQQAGTSSRRSREKRTNESSRAALFVPPPDDSPPRFSLIRAGLVKRRRSSPAHLACGRRENVDADLSYNTGGKSIVSSDSSGKEGKTYGVDGLYDSEGDDESRRRRSGGIIRSGEQGVRQKQQTSEDTRSGEHRYLLDRGGRASPQEPGFEVGQVEQKYRGGKEGRRTGRGTHSRTRDDRRRKSSRDRSREKEGRQSSQFKQLRKSQNGQVDRSTRPGCTTELSDSDDDDCASNASNASNASSASSASSRYTGRKGIRRSSTNTEKISASAEAWGSESTATPSPREPGSGSVGDICGRLNDAEMAWLQEPAGSMTTSHRSESRKDKWSQTQRRAHSGTSGLLHDSTTSSSPTTTASTPREGRSSSFEIFESGGFESETSDTGNRGSSSIEHSRGGSGHARRKGSPLSERRARTDEGVERRARREGRRSFGNDENRGGAGAATRSNTKVANRRSSGERTSTRGNKKTSSRRDDHRREKGRFDLSDEEVPKTLLDGVGDRDAPVKKSERSATSGDVKPRATSGGWFVPVGEGGEKTEKRDCGHNASSPEPVGSSTRQRFAEEEGREEAGDRGRDCAHDSCGAGDSGGGSGALSPREESRYARHSSLMLSYNSGGKSDMVQCIIVRDRSGFNRLYPQYRFFFDGLEGQVMMVAQKCSKNRTSNYHVFDMKRGGFGSRLSKKNGNYLGKVRTNLKRTEATVFTNDQEMAELAAVSFDKPGLIDHVREGSQPRKFDVLLPSLDFDGAPVAHKVDPFDADSNLISCIKQGRNGRMFPLQTREPTFTKGNYRLNFHGRVTVPSVKNFQLVSPDDLLHTVCQFGKVGEDRFHLDYRAPINAFQAFCISLAQFNF